MTSRLFFGHSLNFRQCYARSLILSPNKFSKGFSRKIKYVIATLLLFSAQTFRTTLTSKCKHSVQFVKGYEVDLSSAEVKCKYDAWKWKCRATANMIILFFERLCN